MTALTLTEDSGRRSAFHGFVMCREKSMNSTAMGRSSGSMSDTFLDLQKEALKMGLLITEQTKYKLAKSACAQPCSYAVLGLTRLRRKRNMYFLSSR